MIKNLFMAMILILIADQAFSSERPEVIQMPTLEIKDVMQDGQIVTCSKFSDEVVWICNAI